MKSDGITAQIAEALRRAMCSVTYLDPGGIRAGSGAPDLLVGRAGKTYLLEVKMPKAKLNDNQVRWHREWRGVPVEIVHSVEEALRAVGLLQSEAA